MLWKTPPGIANSAGNLALHLCGNLRHFIGALLGHTGYVRQREAEFSTRSGSREWVVGEIEATIAVIREVLPRLSAETLDAPYPMELAGNTIACRRMLLHLCTHAAFHVGQAGYLRRIITGKPESSGGISLKALGG